jgi:Tfp pilus assembly protein PilF
VLFRQKQYYEAAQHLERAGQLMVDSGVPYANLAVLHGRVGHWDQALKFAKKALKRQPGHHLALRTKARALLETEAEFETIQQTLKQIAVKDPSKRWRQWATARAKAKRDAQPPWERES